MTTKTKRACILSIICLLFLGWNFALSTQREYLSGQYERVKREDVKLFVQAEGKIEPKISKVIRSQIEGQKLKVHVQVGQSVKKGQLLIEISDENIKLELVQKKNAVANARTDYYKAEKNYELEKTLYEQEAVPLREVEAAKEVWKRSWQSLKYSREELKILKRKARGKNVYAPLDGIIIESFVENKDWVEENSKLLTVAKLSESIVRAKIDEINISQVHIDQKAEIALDAFPGQKLTGHVYWIGAQAQKREFADIDVKIHIDPDHELTLKPNLSTMVKIVTGEVKNGLLIPAKSILREGNDTFVLQKHTGGWLTRRPVSVSHINGDSAILEKGFEGGEIIMVPETKTSEYN